MRAVSGRAHHGIAHHFCSLAAAKIIIENGKAELGTHNKKVIDNHDPPPTHNHRNRHPTINSQQSTTDTRQSVTNNDIPTTATSNNQRQHPTADNRQLGSFNKHSKAIV